jgi:beta-glucosidase
VEVSATVKNTETLAGDEVVQLYISNKTGSNNPLRSRVAFKRIHLKPGETQEMKFTIVDEQITKGNVEISIGDGQPDVKNKTTSNVLELIYNN